MEDKRKIDIKTKGCGGSIASILTIIFVIAKILGLVTWSWWICFLPLIIAAGLMLVIIFISIILGIIVTFLDR